MSGNQSSVSLPAQRALNISTVKGLQGDLIDKLSGVSFSDVMADQAVAEKSAKRNAAAENAERQTPVESASPRKKRSTDEDQGVKSSATGSEAQKTKERSSVEEEAPASADKTGGDKAAAGEEDRTTDAGDHGAATVSGEAVAEETISQEEATAQVAGDSTLNQSNPTSSPLPGATATPVQGQADSATPESVEKPLSETTTSTVQAMGSNPEIVTPPAASVDRADMEMSEEEADSALEQALAITQPASPQASATLSGQAQVRATVTPQGAPLASTATAQPGAGEGSSEAPGEAAAETDLDNLLRTSPVVTERAAASPGRGSGYQSEPGFGTQLSQFNPQGAMAPAGANIGAGLGLTLAASRGGATEKPAFRETLLSAISPAASGARAHQPGLVQYQATDGRLQTALPAAVGQPQWGKALGERVMWLASQNIKEADIRLDPPELGQLQVRVSVNQEQASVTFTSPHANVREALDQNAFRLRELFQDGGIDLVNVDVSDQSQSGDSDTESDESGSPSLAGTESEEDAVASTDILGTGLVDHYV